MKVDALDAVADRGQDFVGDGVEQACQLCGREVVAEDFDRVAFAAVRVRHVNHADVHADVADIVRALTVHQTVAAAVAEVSVQAVSIANRNGGDARVTLQNSAAGVAHAVPFRALADLKDGGAQRRHVLQRAVVNGVYAIESQSESHHVEVAFGEAFDACAVADVAKDFVGEGCLQGL